MYGEQSSLVRREVAAPTTMMGRFFSVATLAAANCAAELVPPMITSAPDWSIHSRTFDEEMSALFWWSAKTTSIFLPGNSFCHVGDRHADRLDAACAVDVRIDR